MESDAQGAGYADEPRPLAGYAAIAGAFNALFAAGLAGAARGRGGLPERLSLGDVVLLGTATHKLSRTLAKDSVTSPLRAPFARFEQEAGRGEVEESARGSGLRRAVGELVTCPFCISQWVAGGLACGVVRWPRATRLVAATFAMRALSDALQLAWEAGTAAADRTQQKA